MFNPSQSQMRCIANCLLASVGIGLFSLPLAQAQSLSLDPLSNVSTELKKSPEILAQSIRQADIDKAKVLYQRANSLTKAGELKRAIADYTEVIRLVPTYDKPYIRRGNLRDRLGDSAGALSDYGSAIRINPKNPFAYYNRAVTLEGEKRHKDAIADYSQTIRLKPDFVSAYKNRGLNWLILKNQRNAVSDFEVASKFYKQAGDKKSYQKMQQILNVLKK